MVRRWLPGHSWSLVEPGLKARCTSSRVHTLASLHRGQVQLWPVYGGASRLSVQGMAWS